MGYAAERKLINWPERAKTKPITGKKPGSVDPTFLEIPEAAMYGKLGQVARSLDAPLGHAYLATVTIYAGMVSDSVIDDDDPGSPLRANLFSALLGPAGRGKSVVMDRAIRTLKPSQERIETDTAASDKGIYTLFEDQDDKQPRLRSTTLVQDELRDIMNKIAINGSSLGPVLCKLFNHDRAGSADAKGRHRVWVRLSILGNLKCDDPTDFASVFGANTNHGLYTRFCFAPGPRTKWYFDFTWRPTMQPPPTHVKVRVQPEDFARIKAWETTYEALGYDPVRIGEIALRIAILTAAGNGETTISDACMDAALEFATWQANVKYGYTPGQAKDDDAELADAMLRALHSLGRDGDGHPTRVQFYKLVKRKNWNRKYGPARVNRVKFGLVSTGDIILEKENEGSVEVPRMVETGWLWLNPAEFDGVDQ